MVRKPPAGGGSSAGKKPKGPKGDSDFTQRLYKACKAIPRGRVSTYGELAIVLGSCARAVGQGMRRNPHSPIVPCHRVVAADRRLGGFNGSWGEDTENVRRKKGMLRDEGVRFTPDGWKVDPSCMIYAMELRGLLKEEGGAAAKP